MPEPAGTPAAVPSGIGGYVDELVAWATARLHGEEVLLASFAGEDADFVRFNGGAVRQATSVRQRSIDVDLIEGRRHCQSSVQLSGDAALDRARLADALAQLREQRAFVPEDPYLLYSTEPGRSERIVDSRLPDPNDAVGEIRRAGRERDLVGIYAAGTTYAGFASSLGQRNWYEVSTFSFDWSFYLRADKAAKNSYAGFDWSDAEFGAKVDWSARQLDVLARPPLALPPGHYRTYLAPAAMVELTDMLSWGGFGLKSHRTKQTPLLRMITDGATFAPQVHIVEDTVGGVAPNFGPHGFARPDEVVLIDGGRYADCLVSPRSAQEYGVPTNGASAWESPESIAMAGGSLHRADVLERLGTGLYVGNLWYLNFSDRAACRTTGMTRFATFWVEGGEIVAPVEVLRFDDSMFHLLGDHLVDLTDTTEVLLDPSSYGARSTSSARLPGALVEDMVFTL
jgi:predicted Zn-dependent protease